MKKNRKYKNNFLTITSKYKYIFISICIIVISLIFVVILVEANSLQNNTDTKGKGVYINEFKSGDIIRTELVNENFSNLKTYTESIEDSYTVGSIDYNGDIISGSGFNSTKISKGNYKIIFDKIYNNPPVVIITVYDSYWALSRVKEVTTSYCIVEFRDIGTTNSIDIKFNFIAMSK